MKYTCHSGGCDGADLAWEAVCDEYDIPTISYSFPGHHHKGSSPYVMSEEELLEGWSAVKVADNSLKRGVRRFEIPKYDVTESYVRNLLCRNWFQVKHSHAIMAVGMLKNDTQAEGGTGWAVQMGIDIARPVYFFEQDESHWYRYQYELKRFVKWYEIPPLVKYQDFAGIGTRRLNDNGMEAILEVVKHNFGVRNDRD